jgi:transcriptional regulator with XRE-family HTH domain
MARSTTPESHEAPPERIRERKPAVPIFSPAVLETYRRIGRRMRMAREIMYESQTEFARVMCVDTSTISKVEAGERMLGVLSLMSAGEKLRTGTDFLLKGDLRLVSTPLLLKLVQLHPDLLAEHELAFGPLQPRIPEGVGLAPRRRGGMDTARQAPARSTASCSDTPRDQ